MAAMAIQQVHDKFKIFTGVPAADKTLGPLAEEIAAFARDQKVAAKSIGIEYLEASKRLIISLGYRDDEAAYPVKIESLPLGKIGELASGDVTRLEQAMASASAQIKNIICHELYITDEGDFLVVFMSEADPAPAL
jgi:hypothetical protein